jgi:hypothetical protein
VICNDTVWHDTSGQEIWCNGGHMIREGDRFYWVGYETRPRTGFRNIKLYSSANLVDWKFENNIVRNEGPLSILGWAGRPGLLHNRTTREYVVIFEADSGQWERHKVGFACCDTIGGDYEFVRYVYPEGNRSSGDQSVYQEGDDAYLLCTLDKLIEGKRYLNQSLAIFKLTPNYLDIEKKIYEGFDNVNGDRSVYPRHHTSREASHIIKVNGLYYWFSSGLLGWQSSQTMYATALSLAGPWSDLKVLVTEPASPDSFNTQHDFVIPVTGTQITTLIQLVDITAGLKACIYLRQISLIGSQVERCISSHCLAFHGRGVFLGGRLRCAQGGILISSNVVARACRPVATIDVCADQARDAAIDAKRSGEETQVLVEAGPLKGVAVAGVVLRGLVPGVGGHRLAVP